MNKFRLWMTSLLGAVLLYSCVVKDENVKDIFTEEFYNWITDVSRSKSECTDNAWNTADYTDTSKPIGRFPKEAWVNETPGGVLQINALWYYTYENFMKAIELYPQFMNSKNANINKVELAAFLAHVNQETGFDPGRTPQGIGCKIEEDNGGQWGFGSHDSGNNGNPNLGSGNPDFNMAGYFGRGPHQLTWSVNYLRYQEQVGVDAFKDPDLLTIDPVIGIAGSLWFWNQETFEQASDVIPFKPSSHAVIQGTWEPTPGDIYAGRTKDKAFGVTINIINGGLECIKLNTINPNPPQKAQHRVDTFKAYLDKLGGTLPSGWATWEEQNCSLNQLNFGECYSVAGSVPGYPLNPACDITNFTKKVSTTNNRNLRKRIQSREISLLNK